MAGRDQRRGVAGWTEQSIGDQGAKPATDVEPAVKDAPSDLVGMAGCGLYLFTWAVLIALQLLEWSVPGTVNRRILITSSAEPLLALALGVIIMNVGISIADWEKGEVTIKSWQPNSATYFEYKLSKARPMEFALHLIKTAVVESFRMSLVLVLLPLILIAWLSGGW